MPEPDEGFEEAHPDWGSVPEYRYSNGPGCLLVSFLFVLLLVFMVAS